MKKYVPILILLFFTLCIGQPEEISQGKSSESDEWTVEDWKDYLSVMDPTVTQDASTMLPGFGNPGNLSVGTHLVYDLEMEGTIMGLDVPLKAVMDITFSGKEHIEGVRCFKIDVNSSLEMLTQGRTMKMEMVGTEWIDDVTGELLRAHMEMIGHMEGEDPSLPLSFSIERTGETEYQGHECWILTFTQEMKGEGIEGGKVTILQYVDKQTGDMVRQIMTYGDEEMDSGYIEPVSSGVVWELGNRESVITELGTYECQVITISRNGELVGTLWASKEFTVPLKYVTSVSETGSALTLTMLLVTYERG